jgi:hypothetical protein
MEISTRGSGSWVEILECVVRSRRAGHQKGCGEGVNPAEPNHEFLPAQFPQNGTFPQLSRRIPAPLGLLRNR